MKDNFEIKEEFQTCQQKLKQFHRFKTMSTRLKDQPIQTQIKLLEDLHRPLEEHWCVKARYGLNPTHSEYLFKNHLAHLEEIYKFYRFKIEPPKPAVVMTPVSQLHGVNGLKNLSKEEEELRQSQREHQWKGNFQKYAALDEIDRCERDDYLENMHKKQIRSKKTKSRSPNTHMSSSSPTSIQNEPHHGHHHHHVPTTSSYTGRAYKGNSLTKAELIMLGMYQLNTQQQAVYDQFVDMLKEFGPHDAQSIVEDALADALPEGEENNLLNEFAGAFGAE